MSPIVQEQRTKTAEEAALDQELKATFTSAGACERWMQTPNSILSGDRPGDCARRHEFGRVHAALEALNTGVYI